jgi:hypothetical protein
MQDLDATARRAGAGIGMAGGSMSGMDQTLKQMPERVSRFAGGLGLVANAAGGMGKGVGEAAGKVTFLASQIASGGPAGLAIALLTGAVAAGAAVWKVYGDQANVVRGVVGTIAPVMKGITDRLADQRNTTRSLTDELRFYGIASRDVAIAKAQEALALKSNLPALKLQISADEQALAQKRKEIEAIDTGSIAMGVVHTLRVKEKDAKIDEYNADVAMLNIRKQSIAASEADASQLQIQITTLEKLKVADRNAKEAKRELTEANKDQIETLKIWQENEEKYAAWKKSQQADEIKGISRSFSVEAKRYEMLADYQEATAKALEKEGDKQSELGKIGASTARTVADAWTQAGVAMASGSAKGGEASKQAMFASARAVITAASGEAAAKAIAAHSGIPFVGVAIGLAVAASVAQIILGYLTKFHTGGVIGSNDGTRLPGMASNERAVTVQVGERIQTQAQQRGGSGGGVVINARSLFAPTSADTKRMVNQVGKAMKRQRRLGYT